MEENLHSATALSRTSQTCFIGFMSYGPIYTMNISPLKNYRQTVFCVVLYYHSKKEVGTGSYPAVPHAFLEPHPLSLEES